MSTLVLLHICTAVIGLLSGFGAMMMRKGSSLHAVTGNIFYISMLLMSSSAAYIAAFLHPIAINLVVGLLTFYLVMTARRAAKRRDGTLGAFDRVALVYILVVTATAFGYGFSAVASGIGKKDGIPTPVYFVFGTIALLCSITDVRMLRRGSLVGAHRIARHLWRMSLALLIATLSFYPGQAKLFSKAIRQTNLMFIPMVLLVGTMLLYLVRVRRGIRREGAARRQAAVVAVERMVA